MGLQQALMTVAGDLTPVLAGALSYAQMGRSPHLSPHQQRMLRQRYLHHSADWHASIWKPSPFAIFYVNRPTDDGKRVVIPNEDKA